MSRSENRKTPATGWELAARLCEDSLTVREKAGTALDRFANSLSSAERRTCQRLFFAVVRHLRLIEHTCTTLVTRPPRPRLRGMLLTAMGDMLENGGERHPQVVDFWVGKTRERLSSGEARMVNAVLRRAPAIWDDLARSDQTALHLSHPEWLAKHWRQTLGSDDTRALLAWNQRPPDIYLRQRANMEVLPGGCIPTPWPGFLQWIGGDWGVIQQQLNLGTLYAQDPGTRLAPALLRAQPGERVLDVCAAPGGKSLLLADAMQRGELVCVDQPGPRLVPLRENLAKLRSYPNLNVTLLPMDARELNPATHGNFDAILLDAPCTNTGVIRRRPDVKWRLHPASLCEMALLQRELLDACSRLLGPGGRLVYSTCSIEAAENQEVVDHFLVDTPDFLLEASIISVPWESGHDGAGAFLLTKTASQQYNPNPA